MAYRNTMSKLPLIIILGATGSGKTKLSLDLAKKFGGEIIGADSMQIYKGLDIITAKATPEEQKQAPHHLIDFLQPHEIFTVLDYRNKAVSIIDNLLSQNKLPIVVGGTNYYIESILWKILVEDENTSRAHKPWSNNLQNLANEELHCKLREVDPEMAERLHPNNRRKVIRSLEIYKEKGRKHSDILLEQQNSEGGSNLGGGLRYANSLIFWLRCDQNILDERLNARVDAMMEAGLIKELLDFHKKYNKHRLNNAGVPDYTKGIFQSIGFKEFHEYLIGFTGSKEECQNFNSREEERNRDSPLNENESLTKEIKTQDSTNSPPAKRKKQAKQTNQDLLQKGIEELKMVTRRYARKQNRWITNRLLGIRGREVPPLFGLNTDDVSKWDENVTKPAIEIIESFISGSKCKYERLPFIEVKSKANCEDRSYFCEVCERIFVGEFQWKSHIVSNKHKRKQSKNLVDKNKLNIDT